MSAISSARRIRSGTPSRASSGVARRARSITFWPLTARTCASPERLNSSRTESGMRSSSPRTKPRSSEAASGSVPRSSASSPRRRIASRDRPSRTGGQGRARPCRLRAPVRCRVGDQSLPIERIGLAERAADIDAIADGAAGVGRIGDLDAPVWKSARGSASIRAARLGRSEQESGRLDGGAGFAPQRAGIEGVEASVAERASRQRPQLSPVPIRPGTRVAGPPIRAARPRQG